VQAFLILAGNTAFVRLSFPCAFSASPLIILLYSLFCKSASNDNWV
jgi:hypothetical protein